MGRANLAKLFASLGIWQFTFSVNLFWYERTGQALLQVVVPHRQLPSAILIGEFAIAIVGIAILVVANRYRQLIGPGEWFELVPSAFIELENPDELTAKVLKIVILLAFMVVPAYIGFHFLLFLSDQPIVDRLGQFTPSFWQISNLWQASGTWTDGNRFRIASPDGVTFFPVIEPWLIGILLSLIVIATAGYFGLILTSKHRR